MALVPRLARWRPGGRSLVVAVPILWLGLFFLVPFLVLMKMSLSEPDYGTPPYLPLAQVDAYGVLRIGLNIANYTVLVQDRLYPAAFAESARLAALATLVCLVLGYPMALFIATRAPAWRAILLVAVILPFWTSFLLRVYAWIGILKEDGIVNQLLVGLGLVAAPVQILHTDAAALVGLVYGYLPFMILPLYATLTRLDPVLNEAAADLGARPLVTFVTVTIPQSIPGIAAGCLLVFVPSVGEYVIPSLLGGSDTLMLGRVIYSTFADGRDWPLAAAIALALVAALVPPILVLRRVQGSGSAGDATAPRQGPGATG